MGILLNKKMAVTELETVLVGDLKLGMVVHGIAKQAGKLVVKSKGTVSHLTLIDQLSSNGVISVYVERAKLKSNDTLQKLNDKKQLLQHNKQEAFNKIKHNELSIELAHASKLVKQSKVLHKAFVRELKQGLGLNVLHASELVSDIYISLTRNPNALLIVSMLMESDEYISKHSMRVSVLACYFAKQLGMSEHDCKRMSLLGYVYDIGMLKLPATLLKKPGALNINERSIMQSHVRHSLDILKPLRLDSEMMLAVEQHHERLDGSGYPSAYSGSKISKWSRILAMIDCYDALTTQRVYKDAITPTSALKHLSTPANGYDQKLVLQFIRALGVYPVGSLVMLSNKRIAVVLKNNVNKPTQPQVKVFYSAIGKHYIKPNNVDLVLYPDSLTILKPVLASQYKLDLSNVL